MFLKKRKHGSKTYLSISESYWENGKAKQRTIASLGWAEKLKKEGHLSSLVQSLVEIQQDKVKTTHNLVNVYELEEKDRLNWGAVNVYRTLWDRYDLELILRCAFRQKRIGFDAPQSIFNIIVDRLLHPSSKLKVFKRQTRHMGLKPVALQHLYRCLDLLADQKEKIEDQLFFKNRDLFSLNIDIVFYDVTTLHFESVKVNSLKNFGYSKDGKFKEVQVVVGLLIDPEGIPIGFDVYPGNTFEGHTLEKVLTKLKKRFNIRHVIIVADRGINSKINLKSIKDMGFDYVVGCRLKTLAKDIQKEVLDIDSYKDLPIHTSIEEEQFVLKIKELAYKNELIYPDPQSPKKKKRERLIERLICTWSSKRAEKDKKDRQRLTEKALKLLENPSQLKYTRGAKKYISSITDPNPALDTEKIKKDQQWDGFYGIQCSHSKISPQEIMDAYKTLWKIEESFGIFKTTLQARPVFHWTEKRIRGHLVCCFIAFLLERTLEIKLKENKISHSVEKIREALQQLEASLVSVDNEEYYLRSSVSGLAREILTTLKIKMPRSLLPVSEFPL